LPLYNNDIVNRLLHTCIQYKCRERCIYRPSRILNKVLAGEEKPTSAASIVRGITSHRHNVT